MTMKEIDQKFNREVIEVIEGGLKRQKNYLIVCMFAGHGILRDGMQTLMLNEYD